MTVTLDWFGCATFRLGLPGLTVFLDAYIDRAPNSPGSGLTADDIDDCDWIVVGHSHFDHLYGAERIVTNTRATLIASYESVRLMEQAGVPAERMICVAGGERIDLGEGVSVSVFPSQHSCVWSHRQMPQSGEVCLGDLGVTWHEQRRRLGELMEYIRSELDPAAVAHTLAARPGHSERGDGGALVFVFETPSGSLLFQDTSGHWSGVFANLAVDVAILAAAGRANIDGEPVQGSLAEFVADEAQTLNARRVVLGHHDNWLPGFSVDTDLEPIRAAFAERAPGAELLETGYLAGTPIFDGLPVSDRPSDRDRYG
jgi:L-ascorbate metabolism protein UlaG (beta-lactamase superfamily)